MYESFKRSIQPLINVYHLIKAVLANIYFAFPSRRIKVIGVTGTDGKTTTAHLIYHILESTGKKVSIVSSIYAKIGNLEYETGLHTTTPDAIEVQRLLKKAADAGDEYIVIETTSHALDQNRVYGINYEVSVITNITLEHLDYHKTYENYLKTKAKLLLRSKKSVINIDDRSYDSLKQILRQHDRKIYSYGLKNKANFRRDFRKELKDLTDYNNYNYLAAYAVTDLLGFDEREIIDALKKFKLPIGRLEIIYDKDFKAIVDFAHTPNSVEQVLAAIKKQFLGKDGRLIHVFGSAGLRDNKKRSSMGEASAKYADIIILTEEDYRTEDPAKIAQEIEKGVEREGKKPYAVILDRAEAIQKAVEIAKKGDVIVTTGKSHEKSLCRGKIEYPWNEKETLMKAIEKSIRG